MNKQVRVMIGSNAGGSGKTTSAVHLAFELSRLGYSSVVIELDYSASISTFTGLDLSPAWEESVASVLNIDFNGDYPIKKIWTDHTDKIGVIQGGASLEESIRVIPSTPRGHYALSDRLKDYPIDADVVLFDTPGSLEPMGVLALAASTHLLCPIKPELKDAEGLFGFVLWYQATVKNFRIEPRPEFLGFLPMRVDLANTAMHRNVLGLDRKGNKRKDLEYSQTLPGMLEGLNIHCFPPIKESKNYLGACIEGRPLGLYRPGSPSSNDFSCVAEQIKKIIEV